MSAGVWRDVAGRMAAWRRGLREMARPRDGLRILTIVHAGGGGTIHTNEDLMHALSPAHACWILSCGPEKWVLWSVTEGTLSRAQEVRFDAPWRADAPCGVRGRALADLLAQLRPDVVHVRSMLGSGPEALAIAKASGAALVVSFHDYLAICPSLNLLDAEQRFCAGDCTPSAADCAAPQKWFSGIGRLKGAFVHGWRARVAEALPTADAFVTTSPGAATLMKRHFGAALGDRPFAVIEHGRDLAFRANAAPPSAPMRVVALNINARSKGADVVRALLARNAEAGRPLAFHLLGGDWTLAPQDGVAHGAYAREALPDLLAGIAPSVSLIPSLWPETYSHTLTESWAAGAPVLTSDSGALAERIRAHGGGWLAPPGDADAWFAALQRIAADPADWRARADDIARMPRRTVADMAADYLALYRRVRT